MIYEKAYAKVNLSLSVLGKMDNGFHELETIMVPITLHDTLYFRKNNTVEIYNATNGQGYRRTAMAEAFRDSLIKMGFKSYVYYLMD